MDGHLLEQIQKELRSFEDHQLWALMDLMVEEMQARGFLDPDAPPPFAPDTDNRDEPEEDDLKGIP